MIKSLTKQPGRRKMTAMNTDRFKQLTVFRRDAEAFMAEAKRQRRTYAVMFALLIERLLNNGSKNDSAADRDVTAKES